MKYWSIIEQMTIEEKASLMSGKDFWQTQEINRLSIPSLFLADGPHGIRRQAVDGDQIGLNEGIPATSFPTAATVANSWNEELGERVGEYLGEEAIAQKVNVILGPGVNMKRNPLCGRNFEYFSEDPYHAGKMAAAYTRGIQSHGIASCVKHFAVNNQEERRMSIDVVVDERTLREIYLTAFEIAVKEGRTKAIMSSYNRLNGEYTNEHQHLMNDILRDEWEYDGVVISEWGGSNERVKGLLAGNELEMPGNAGESDREIIDAIKNGRLDESILDEAVDRLLDFAFSTKISDKQSNVSFNKERHHRLSQKVAEESIVLLKNESKILPLNFNQKIAVIGDFAQNARYQGAGSSQVNPTILDHTMNSFEESGLTTIGFEQGFHRYGKKDQKKITRACNLAKDADIVLLYIGLDESIEVEGLDRSSMKLPQNQIELLENLYEINDNIIAVLSSGSAIEMPWINKVKGLIHGYLGGQAGARALLRVLSGDVNPSGKLSETYPIKYEDSPSYRYFPGNEKTVEYREGLYIGYRYFDTVNKQVLFPFGYGLSYTTFEYSNLKVDKFGATFNIKNTGKVAGNEVAQLYVSGPRDKIFRPLKELKGFSKTFINAGETKTMTIVFDDKTFRYFNVETNQWEVETGNYYIIIGSSSSSIELEVPHYIEGTDHSLPYQPEKLTNYFTGTVQNIPSEQFEALIKREIPEKDWDKNKPLEHNDIISQMKYAKSLLARLTYHSLVFVHCLLRKIGKREKANLMHMSMFNLTFRGIAKVTGGVINLPMVDGILIMVNGRFFKGLNVFVREKRKKSFK